MRGSKSIAVAAVYDRRIYPAIADRRSVQLAFFARARSLGAAVALGEFFNTTGRVDEFLFAREKRMASGADTDSNVAPGRASVIHRAACANHVGFVILWVNACFHVRK
jgi:hypothetical protein